MPRLYLSVLLLATLIGALVYRWSPSAITQLYQSSGQLSLAKTYLVNTRSRTYDESGALAEIMEASDLRYFPSEKHSLIVAPRFYSHDGNDQTWSVSSERGRFLHNRETLILDGNVVLVNDQNGRRLNTEAMHINLDKKIATSNVLVTITQGLNTISANGMTANLMTEQIRMKPNVESVYVPATH